MYKKNRYTLIIILLGLCVPTVHKAMPLALMLQKGLVLGTYGYNLWSFAQKGKWIPKSMKLKNKELKEAKKEKKEIKTHLHYGLMQLLTDKQKEAFVYQNEMCKKYFPASAAIADKNACALMMLCFFNLHAKTILSYQL